MKKIIIQTCVIGVMSMFSACQGDKKVDTYSEDIISTEEKSMNESPSNSSFKLKLELEDLEYMEREVDVNESQGGTEISNGAFAVVFYAKASEGSNNELQIQFNLSDFDMTPGKVNVKQSEIYQSEVVNEMDVVLTGKDVNLEITEIVKISSESQAGMILTHYEFGGIFSGTYKSMGGKEIEIENGSFEKAHLSVIRFD
ncbi:hypothetical protein ACFOUP_01360 [Belliella kenyensis]|uniref:Lipoprotein n=1 Tax=Belliella kenyensis TaxID=1472724 RepID=A0ABV8EFH3_9BACT|nr:hypothetical protein [Belliella kenyensis]MCH7401157.1 hypothetical protein [Belliella kenyensis]MDN3604154.1 hypothetical protein [Belliella kenyensis]